MERIIRDNERIKRAEEFYSLRRNNIKNKAQNCDHNDISVIKYKIALNLCLILNIGLIILAIQNKEFIFTSEFRNEIFASGEIIKNQLYERVYSFFNDEEIDQNQQEVDEIKDSLKDENIVEEPQKEELVSSISEMETDIENLKNAYSFMLPIKGTITSRFGNRVSDNINVNGYHTGMDIAENKGTEIVASMQGIVTLVSSKGDYGKHIKIRCNNITTLYAHCDKIFVKEGQIVAQGQKIASVGTTGNTTGPHLHFEIRVDDRFVDPERILCL